MADGINSPEENSKPLTPEDSKTIPSKVDEWVKESFKNLPQPAEEPSQDAIFEDGDEVDTANAVQKWLTNRSEREAKEKDEASKLANIKIKAVIGMPREVNLDNPDSFEESKPPGLIDFEDPNVKIAENSPNPRTRKANLPEISKHKFVEVRSEATKEILGNVFGSPKYDLNPQVFEHIKKTEAGFEILYDDIREKIALVEENPKAARAVNLLSLSDESPGVDGDDLEEVYEMERTGKGKSLDDDENIGPISEAICRLAILRLFGFNLDEKYQVIGNMELNQPFYEENLVRTVQIYSSPLHQNLYFIRETERFISGPESGKLRSVIEDLGIARLGVLLEEYGGLA